LISIHDFIFNVAHCRVSSVEQADTGEETFASNRIPPDTIPDILSQRYFVYFSCNLLLQLCFQLFWIGIKKAFIYTGLGKDTAINCRGSVWETSVKFVRS